VREMLVNNGVNRTEAEREVPDQPPRFVKIKEVQAITSLGERTIYRRMREGTFPKPIRTDAAAAPKTLPRPRVIDRKPVGKRRTG